MKDLEEIEKILKNLSTKDRKKFLNYINRAGKKRYSFSEQGYWTKERLIKKIKEAIELLSPEYLSSDKLQKLRKENPDYWPAVATIQNRFGSWKEALYACGVEEVDNKGRVLNGGFGGFENLAFGKIPFDDPNYYYNVINMLRIKNKDDYLKARKEYPKIVPSMRKVEELFGSWINLKKFHKLGNLNKQMTLLIKLTKKNNGYFPNWRRCYENGINVKKLRSTYGSKAKLKEVVRTLLRTLRKQEKEK